MPAKRNLFTIGEFSNVTGVGIHSLRYYDEIGVLKPEYVDPVSNYRYYGFEQLRRMPGINICKDAGIRLSEFDRFMKDSRINYAELLRDSRKSIDRKIEEYRAQQRDLDKMETQLKIMEAAFNKEIISVDLSGYDIWTMPFDKESLPDNDAAFLVRLSSHAKRRGCQISPVCFGLIQTIDESGSHTKAFALISSMTDQAASSGCVFHLDSGTYLIRACSSCSLRNAAEISPDDSMREGSILLSFCLTGSGWEDNLFFAALHV